MDWETALDVLESVHVDGRSAEGGGATAQLTLADGVTLRTDESHLVQGRLHVEGSGGGGGQTSQSSIVGQPMELDRGGEPALGDIGSKQVRGNPEHAAHAWTEVRDAASHVLAGRKGALVALCAAAVWGHALHLCCVLSV